MIAGEPEGPLGSLSVMDEVGKGFRRAAVFGASGGIGMALVEALLDRGIEVWAGSRAGLPLVAGSHAFRFDLKDEASIASVADRMRESPPDLVIVATGVLTLNDGTGPEKSYRHVDGEAMLEVIRLNTVGPALIAKHMLPLFPRHQRAVFAALSARVGSIGDNRLGGWHSYRASKAGLNMLLRNLSVEMARTNPQAIVAGLHPGTVDTQLSLPFQGHLREGQLMRPDQAAHQLLSVLQALRPADSGAVFDYSGKILPA